MKKGQTAPSLPNSVSVIPPPGIQVSTNMGVKDIDDLLDRGFWAVVNSNPIDKMLPQDVANCCIEGYGQEISLANAVLPKGEKHKPVHRLVVRHVAWLLLNSGLVDNIKDVSKIKRNAPAIYIWKNHKYIKCDGIFNVVVSHHGNVYKVKDIGRTKEYYLVGDGNGKWAHGDTIDDAKKDLLYKISNRDKTGYKNLTLDSILSYEEAIECYRVITGACSSGTKGFCENRLGEIKNHYTIREIIELTEGEYGNNEFKDFFQQVS